MNGKIRIEKKLEQVREALEKIKAGGLVLVRDDEGRENEGDLVGAASLADERMVAFMAVHGRGLVCQSVTEETARRLQLHPQTPSNTDAMGTAFTVSVDAARGISTGISGADRARTARILADPRSVPEQLTRPGHLFPLVARKGGVLVRPGHTEASADLARLAGLEPSGLICEVMQEDGSMARGPELEKLAAEWDMPLISVKDIVAYREALGDIVLEETDSAMMPTEHGEFRIRAFRCEDAAASEMLLLESRDRGEVPLVRLHSECLTGDGFHSLRCDCGPQLTAALSRIAAEGGALVYLKQEGRGIGIFEKIRAYTLQDRGLDTVSANIALGHEADLRRYGSAAAALKKAGYTRVRLLTNNPEKVAALERAGIEVVERISHYHGANRHNLRYVQTKIDQMGHYAPRKLKEIAL
ncbi:GTP cyclohydrolase II [Marispirochaeta aestuarii]|uniref:GTP cyclohydrolase II n=1 Tax=Marispirochaeta aestuarii TaxID=1963862 RepID=UPI0029C97427|nr:GTP cyclohydrolase II [Marispirochaeta aestuarii]